MAAGLTNVGQDLLAARLLLILCQLVLEGGAVLGVALCLLLLLLQPFLWPHSKFEYTRDRMPTSASRAFSWQDNLVTVSNFAMHVWM